MSSNDCVVREKGEKFIQTLVLREHDVFKIKHMRFVSRYVCFPTTDLVFFYIQWINETCTVSIVELLPKFLMPPPP